MAAAIVAVDLTAVQDALRPARGFINTLAGLANDQSYANQDGYAYNQPGQFQIIGSDGAAIEGTTYYTVQQQAAKRQSNLMLWALVGLAVFVALK
jgi:hypothetical protein